MPESTLDVDSLITSDWRVHGDTYTSSEVFAAEMERIFGKTWVYVGHESEIDEPGAYKATMIGGQPVILARGADDGVVRAFMNRCRHRGATVCQTRFGSANFFRCAYHGWTYRSDGSLLGVPFEDRYGPDFDKASLGLTPVPRLDTYQGFIFASLSPAGISLREHLGPAADYLDYISTMSPGGIRLDAGVQRLAYDASWKLQLENTIDLYHFNFVHRTYLKLLERRSGQKSEFVKNVRANDDWQTLDLGNGHSAHNYGPWQDQDAAGGHSLGIGDIPFNLIIFPNLGFVGTQVRVILPVAVDRTEVEIYPITLVDASEEENRQRIRNHEGFYGPASSGLPDDLEVGFDRVRLGMGAKLDDWILLQRGADDEKDRGDGVLVGRSADELPQRALYRGWLKLMQAGAGDTAKERA